MSDVTGVLLAGGASRRFPPNKLLHRIKGEPLFWRPLRVLAATCGEIVLVVGANTPELPLPLLDASLHVVRDRTADQGPLVALDTALGQVTSEWALLVGGDMPELAKPLLRALIAHARTSSADAIALSDAGQAWPMPAVLRVLAARAAVTHLVDSGERRLRAILDALSTAALDERWWSQHDAAGSWRRDVDKPADLV